MLIFSTFEESSYLELAISLLEHNGIKKEEILAVPLDNRQEERRVLDTLHRSDGFSLIDIAMALATAFSVIGASIGFILVWGPIFWGLIGAVLGFLLGLGIKLLMIKMDKNDKKRISGKNSEIILIINCKEADAEIVEKVLWEHLAIGVGKLVDHKGSETLYEKSKN